jgi:DNA-binding transcriptional regulator YiaG
VDTPELVVPQCAACGELVFTDQVEQQVDRVFRAQLHLLTAEQIRTNRLALDLSRQELAARLGVEEDLLRRWEDDLLIPSRAHDNLLRLYFGLPQVRSVLTAADHLELGTCVVH